MYPVVVVVLASIVVGALGAQIDTITTLAPVNKGMCKMEDWCLGAHAEIARLGQGLSDRCRFLCCAVCNRFARAYFVTLVRRLLPYAFTPADTDVQYEIRLFSGTGCQTVTGDYFGTSGACYTPPAGSSSCVTTMATYLGNNQFNVLCCSNNACNGGCTSYVLNRYSCYTASQLWSGQFEYDLQGCGGVTNTTSRALVPASAQTPGNVPSIPSPVRAGGVIGTCFVQCRTLGRQVFMVCG
jgi:hypothetical protein